MTAQTGKLYWAYGSGQNYYWSPHKNLAQSWVAEHSARMISQMIKDDHSLISLEHCTDTHPTYYIITKMQPEQEQTQQQPKASNWNGRVRRPAGANQQTTTPNPFQPQANGDLADRISDGVAKSFSPGGLVILGGSTFTIAAFLNLGFWGAVTAGMPIGAVIEKSLMQDWAVLGLACGGFGISAVTTFFQVWPIISHKEGDSIAKQFLASLFRPDLTTIKGGDYEIANAHNKIQADAWKMMKWMWFGCTVFETLAGIIMIGDVFGKGMASFWALLLFLFSIAGCQLGAFWVVQGRNLRLPASGRGLMRRLEQSSVSSAYSQIKK